MIEYAVIVGVILAVSVGVFIVIGKKIDNRFNAVTNSICTGSSEC